MQKLKSRVYSNAYKDKNNIALREKYTELDFMYDN